MMFLQLKRLNSHFNITYLEDQCWMNGYAREHSVEFFLWVEEIREFLRVWKVPGVSGVRVGHDLINGLDYPVDAGVGQLQWLRLPLIPSLEMCKLVHFCVLDGVLKVEGLI